MSQKPPKAEADASFPSGLLLGLLAGAGLVIVLSPEFRAKVAGASQRLGISSPEPGLPEAEELSGRVAPPPDPLGSALEPQYNEEPAPSGAAERPTESSRRE